MLPTNTTQDLDYCLRFCYEHKSYRSAKALLRSRLKTVWFKLCCDSAVLLLRYARRDAQKMPCRNAFANAQIPIYPTPDMRCHAPAPCLNSVYASDRMM